MTWIQPPFTRSHVLVQPRVATPEEVTEQGCCVGVDAVVVAVEQVVGDQAVEALRDRARRLLEAVGVSRITASERLKKLRYAGLVE